jgi:hypothetical protein
MALDFKWLPMVTDHMMIQWEITGRPEQLRACA